MPFVLELYEIIAAFLLLITLKRGLVVHKFVPCDCKYCALMECRVIRSCIDC